MMQDLPRPCAAQWRWFLQLLGREWALSADTPALRQRLLADGAHCAQVHALPAGTDLHGLEAAMNAVWSALQWGWVRVSDQGDHLRLDHHDAPLADAFGAELLDTTSALLEGCYAAWLRAAGAPPALVLRRSAAPLPPQVLRFELARNAATRCGTRTAPGQHAQDQHPQEA
jgi:hypothetical protein